MWRARGLARRRASRAACRSRRGAHTRPRHVRQSRIASSLCCPRFCNGYGFLLFQKKPNPFSIEEETKVTPFQNQSPTLTYDVFALKRPGLTRDLPPGTESLQWTANTATLIAGSQDAVLVDTFATIDQNRQLVDWMKKSGKNLTTISITHAHGDHAFGIKILLDHFPHARAVVAPAVAKAMHAQIDPDYLNNFWETRFPGQLPEPLVVPEALDSNEFAVEGQKLVVI